MILIRFIETIVWVIIICNSEPRIQVGSKRIVSCTLFLWWRVGHLYRAFSGDARRKGWANGMHRLSSLLFSLLAVFFFQIDMHLVRQQVALYLFIIFLFSKGSFRYVSLMLSVLYHEVIAIFVFCLLASSFIQRYWTKTGRTDLLFAIPLALVIGLDAGDISAGLLLVLLIFAFFLFRFDSSPRILISVLLIFGIVADFSGLLSPINGERYLGVVVAFYMFTFVFIIF